MAIGAEQFGVLDVVTGQDTKAANQTESTKLENVHEDLHHIINPRHSFGGHLGADAHPPQWSGILAPYLEGALSSLGSYTSNEVYQHVQFFTKYTAPWLGVGPKRDSSNPNALYIPQYPSSMTNDFTPFELSCCWKDRNQNGKPIVRYVLDVAPSLPDGGRSSSFTRALEAIQTLKNVAAEASEQSQIDVFPDLWKSITEALMQYELQMHQNSCPHCAPSTTFVGFDLTHCKTKVKFYWLLPSCQTTPQLLRMLDHVFHSCSTLDPFFASHAFVDAWRQIRDHIELYPDTLRPRMLSVDATKFPSPRIKLYTRCLFTRSKDFAAVESHLTLDGKIDLSADFTSTCDNLWKSLITNPDGTMSKLGVPPSYCLLFHEIMGSAGSQASLSSKLYVSCQEIPRRDSFVAQQLLTHCRVLKDAPLLEAFAKHRSPTAFITEIGLAPRKNDVETAIYFSPYWFSKHLWKDCEDADGFFSKIRVNLSSVDVRHAALASPQTHASSDE